MREERKKGKKKGIYTILMLICAVVFLFALYKVVDILMEYKQIDDFYDGAQEEYVDLEAKPLTIATGRPIDELTAMRMRKKLEAQRLQRATA